MLKVVICTNSTSQRRNCILAKRGPSAKSHYYTKGSGNGIIAGKLLIPPRTFFSCTSCLQCPPSTSTLCILRASLRRAWSTARCRHGPPPHSPTSRRSRISYSARGRGGHGSFGELRSPLTGAHLVSYGYEPITCSIPQHLINFFT